MVVNRCPVSKAKFILDCGSIALFHLYSCQVVGLFQLFIISLIISQNNYVRTDNFHTVNSTLEFTLTRALTIR